MRCHPVQDCVLEGCVEKVQGYKSGDDPVSDSADPLWNSGEG